MSRTPAVFLVFLLSLSLAFIVKPVACGATTVRVDPSLIEYYQDATGQQFTVAIKIVDVTNLYGFDIKLRWNTTFIEYVSHSVHVPKDTYSDGVLWNPLVFSLDQVDADAGTYWIAYSSRYPAPSFNGTGTVFTMTFQVKYHPVQPEPDAHLTLELYETSLADKGAGPIPHIRQDGTVILHALLVNIDVAVTNVISLKTIVGKGYSLRINVTAANQGDTTEAFNVTTYANTTLIASQAVTLATGSSRNITFTWNTNSSAFAKGHYVVSAYIPPLHGETDIGDNSRSDGNVNVTLVGDVNGDKKVDLKDVFAVGKAFASVRNGMMFWHGSPPGNSCCPHSPNCDINDDDKIDLKDYFVTCKNFGKQW